MSESPVDCPRCGMPVDLRLEPQCPKCGNELGNLLVDEILTIDIAHNGEDWPLAQSKLMNGLNEVLARRYKGLKVIHGRGGAHVIKNLALRTLRDLEKKYKAKLVPEKNNDGAHILFFNVRDRS